MPLLINCHRCSKEFPIKPYLEGRLKYCSKICRAGLKTKSCPRCQKEFKVKTSHFELKKYCSKACFTTAKIKNCARCQKPFKVKKIRFDIQKYCSPECRKTANIKICLNCKNDFKPHSQGKKQKFCSHKCGCEYRLNDLTGKRFGKSVAIKRSPSRHGKTYWILLCDCGTEFERGQPQLISGNADLNCGCESYLKFPREIREQIRARRKEDYILHRDRVVVYGTNRRARKKGIAERITIEQWQAKLTYFGYRCYLCNEDLQNKIIHLEHRIPLSKGGTNWISNIAPACDKCNLTKGIKTEKEFKEYLAQN